MRVGLTLLGWVFVAASIARSDGPAPIRVPPETVARRVLDGTKRYLDEFADSRTGVLYGAPLSTKRHWTTPADVKSGKPHPWGYGSRIADTALHGGHLLVALLDAQAARPDPLLEASIRQTFASLRLIGSLPERYPKPGLPDLVGLVPRGPHPDDMTAYYDDSSMDQHTTYMIALALYARSPMASEEERHWIAESLGKVGRRLEHHGWSIKRGDGRTEAHVGFAWTGFRCDHASILLPAVLALHRGTNDSHWKDVYERFLGEKNGLRWQRLHAGPHVRINGHPIYANQSAFRIHAMYVMESNDKRKEVLGRLLRQIAELQLTRDFPGSFYRRFHSDAEWNRLSSSAGWSDRDLHGAVEAWRLFRPSMVEQGGLPVLAHVRFPLGGMHMVMLSRDDELIRHHLATIWSMLTTVDWRKVGAGETRYLTTVVGLHLYAYCFRHPEVVGRISRRSASSRRLPMGGGRPHDAAR